MEAIVRELARRAAQMRPNDSDWKYAERRAGMPAAYDRLLTLLGGGAPLFEIAYKGPHGPRYKAFNYTDGVFLRTCKSDEGNRWCGLVECLGHNATLAYTESHRTDPWAAILSAVERHLLELLCSGTPLAEIDPRYVEMWRLIPPTLGWFQSVGLDGTLYRKSVEPLDPAQQAALGHCSDFGRLERLAVPVE